MGLSAYLQSPHILREASGLAPDTLRDFILDTCGRWYADNPQERALIRHNVTRLGIPAPEDRLREIERHIALHYFEKFLPHLFTPAEYAAFLEERVDCTEAVTLLKESADAHAGTLLVTAHFGAIEFLIPCLSMHRLPLSTAVRFTTEQFSRQMHAHARHMHESGRFSLVNILEIGKPGTLIALEMLKVLRRKEILFSVFDEKTPYSVPVELLGKTVWGGAGLDRLLDSCKEPVALCTAFMVRTGESSFHLRLFRIDAAQNPVQGMFDSLERIVSEHPQQWYFLHEEIPFVE